MQHGSPGIIWPAVEEYSNSTGPLAQFELPVSNLENLGMPNKSVDYHSKNTVSSLQPKGFACSEKLVQRLLSANINFLPGLRNYPIESGCVRFQIDRVQDTERVMSRFSSPCVATLCVGGNSRPARPRPFAGQRLAQHLRVSL